MAGSVYDPTPGDPTTSTSTGGKDQGGSGTGYDPTATGKMIGNKLTGYLNGKTPTFGKWLTPEFMDPRTQSGLSRGFDVANMIDQGGGLQKSYDWTSGLIDSGGLTPDMKSDISKVGDIAGQFGSIVPSGPSLTEQRFGNEQYGVNAPGYDVLRKKLADDVTTQSLAAFNSSGMFGSDSNQKSLAEGLGTALGGLDLSQYQYGEGLKRADTAAIEGQRQQGINNMMNALGGQLGAYGQKYGMGQGGIANVTGATDRLGARFGDLLAPSGSMADIGQRFQDDTQRRLLGEGDYFDRSQNADYNRTMDILTAFTGSQGNSGMKEQVPWYEQLFGYVLGNAGNAAKTYAGM